jgi:hypothetical protein
VNIACELVGIFSGVSYIDVMYLVKGMIFTMLFKADYRSSLNQKKLINHLPDNFQHGLSEHVKFSL